ncbi:MAG: CARDB domain-containing protein [Lachnospiraceae bacterium]|nr:CARDB domain-containing protein [Lachnospiraceae bacterium]
MDKSFRWKKGILVLSVAAACFFAMPFSITVHATEQNGTQNTTQQTTIQTYGNDSNRIINDDDRFDADEDLLYYMQSLEVRYRLDEKVMENLHKAFDSAVYYIANTDMTVAELQSYVAQTKSTFESTAVANVSITTSEFLQVGDNWETPTVSYGQSVAIVLPVINFGTEELNDLIIEPQTSTVVSEWPFMPDKTSYLQTEPYIPGNQTYAAAMENRREFTFYFTAREDVMSGYYPLKFNVWYTKSGIRCEEPAELTVYVKAIGKPGSGTIGGSGEETNGAKPRIIVTGFETSPAEVYAGDTFVLTVHVKNTSKEMAVTNLLFDMQAAVEGEDKTNTYAAFLPTSGSSSFYMEKIAPDTSADIEIEMTAKADLAQKPYVLDVNMKYDAGSMFDLTDKASVSIPILQESRFDISTPEIVPSDITVGSQSNVMFSIYNTGKTTLYNVQVKFKADSIEEASSFVGNLASGATGNIDVMLTGIAPTMDDGTVNVEISYEDDAGNVTTETKTIILYVMEEVYDDYMMDDMMMEMEEEPKKPVGLVVAIVIIVILAAGAGGFLFIRHRKKKKAEKLLEDDLLAIEEDVKSETTVISEGKDIPEDDAGKDENKKED